MIRNYSRGYLARNRAYARQTKSSMLYGLRALHGCCLCAAWLRFCLDGSKNLGAFDTRARPETTSANISPKTEPMDSGANPAYYMSIELCMDAAFAPLGCVSVSPVRGIWP